MKQLTDFLKGLNKNQRVIFAIATPVILGILFTYIAGHWEDFTDSQPDWDDWNDPFNFEHTWLLWLIYSGLILFFEFKLFGANNDND